ncbi:MAG TPA: patatin-like phospholipase family protein [Nitrospiria bacterium]|nr:patatin-like phospholipase family protein [Nitrospiria bacterium]
MTTQTSEVHGEHGGAVALALSGGAARAAGHVGVLCALADAGVPIAGVVGTSAGAFVGALFASGRYSADELEEVARGLRWTDVLRPALSMRGFWTSEQVGTALRRLIGGLRFSDLRRPFAAVACDLRTGEQVLLQEGDVCCAVQASCSLPVFFTPTIVGDRVLVDGGAVSQLPVLAARAQFPGSPIVGVDVNYRATETARLSNMVSVGVQVVSLFARQNAARERAEADLMIDVDAAGVALYDLAKRDLMIVRGRAAAKAALANNPHIARTAKIPPR